MRLRFERYFFHHRAKYLSKRSLIKYICSWNDKLIILWTMNREAKIFLRIRRNVLKTERQSPSVFWNIAVLKRILQGKYSLRSISPVNLKTEVFITSNILLNKGKAFQCISFGIPDQLLQLFFRQKQSSGGVL